MKICYIKYAAYSRITEPRHRYLTRDQYLRVKTLLKAEIGNRQIARDENFIKRQVNYAVQYLAISKKRDKRPLLITEDQLNQTIEWICNSKENRRTK